MHSLNSKFLSAMGLCCCSSKDQKFFLLSYFFLPCALRQNLDKNQNLGKQINSLHVVITQLTLPMQCKQRTPPKKFLPKKFLQKNPNNFQTISQRIPKILKISNSLHRTQRQKTLWGLLSSRFILPIAEILSGKNVCAWVSIDFK